MLWLYYNNIMFNATSTCEQIATTTENCTYFATFTLPEIENLEWLLLPQIVIILLMSMWIIISIINFKSPWRN